MGEVISLFRYDSDGKRIIGRGVTKETQEGVFFEGEIYDTDGPDVA